MTDYSVYAIVILLLIAVAFGVVRLMRLPVETLILSLSGVLVGLLIGALISVPLSNLPSVYGSVLPVAVSLMITVAVVGVFLNQREALRRFIPSGKERPSRQGADATPERERVLVDTSAIIDGRIADIAKAGFLRTHLLVPRFVLAELQNIADSDEPMRRGRGRRGLEMLHSLQTEGGITTEVIDDDLPEIKEVDAKLVGLGQKFGVDILTTDYNLNRVAEIQGVRVLNVNELANAIRPVVLPGEQMLVKVVQAGKERGQGVGYLPDGTMIVVEQGDKLIGQEVSCEVTRVFQTVAGKMIFASPIKQNQPSSGSGSQGSSGSRPPRNKNQKNHDKTAQSDAPKKTPGRLSERQLEDLVIEQAKRVD